MKHIQQLLITKDNRILDDITTPCREDCEFRQQVRDRMQQILDEWECGDKCYKMSLWIKRCPQDNEECEIIAQKIRT